MRTVKTTKPEIEQKSWVLPGLKLTHDEFIAGIHKAGKGPFHTIEEVQSLRDQWRNSKKNP